MENSQQSGMDMLTPRIFRGEGVKNKYMDLPYGPLEEQLLDIYLPDEPEGLLPVIFEIHGGGWVAGTKNEGFTDVLIDFIRHGYALISVNYRLAPATMFPGNIIDVKAAVRWTRAHADQYGLDPGRFGMIGDSAGGHLSLMAGFTADRPEFREFGWEDWSDSVQAVVNAFGISLVSNEMSRRFFEESGVPPMQYTGASLDDFTNWTFGGNAYLAERTSPVNYVHKDIPPVLSLHGRLDSVVPYQQSVLVHEKITRVCGPGRSELILYDDRGHEDVQFNGGKDQKGDLCETARVFFDKYLK